MTHDAYSTKRVTVWPQKRGDEDGMAIKYQDGYISWCPKAVFERDYQPITAMSFGHAIHALKAGKRVARAGWNGKGMFVYLVPADSYPAQTGAAKAHFGEGAMVPYNAYLAIKNVTETVSTWVPSINDVLADDWQLLGEV